MKYIREYGRLLQHSYLLRTSINLAYDRYQQLQQTILHLGFPEMPTDHEDITQVQVQAAKDIGGINTRMLLDAPAEMEKYHFGPLQMSLCLLFAIFHEYARLASINTVFSENEMDAFRHRNHAILQSLRELRHSILHERYDNVDVQKRFVSSHAGNPMRLAIEGEQVFQRYLKLLWDRLQGDD